MISQSLVMELQQILVTEFGINADLKESASIGNSLTKYFEVLINMKKNEKLKVSTQKLHY